LKEINPENALEDTKKTLINQQKEQEKRNIAARDDVDATFCPFDYNHLISYI